MIGVQLAKSEEAMKAHAETSRNALKARKIKAETAAMKALSNPRPLPKRKQAAYAPMFGYRVVKRYDKLGNTWMEVSDVLYHNGKPCTFSLTPVTLVAEQRNPLMDLSDAQALAILREKHQLILAALSQPILDERTDFSR